MITDILKVIVSGYEHGGTTLINEILRKHPKLDSGFECGALLAESPQKFLKSKYRAYNQSLIQNGWGINREELEYICQASAWDDFYYRLREKSRVVTDKDVCLFDKTPKYMLHLEQILGRIEDVPCIVIVKDPRGVLWSWIKRLYVEKERKLTDAGLMALTRRYVDYARGCNEAWKKYQDRIMFIDYNAFCENPEPYARTMIDFIGLEFDPSCLNFESKYGVYSNSVSSKYIDEYIDKLPRETIEKIVNWTREATDYFSQWKRI